MARRGLLVDYGGVLTSSVFDSFAAFCAAEGLAPTAVRDAFRDEPTGRQLLFDLETGHLPEAEFERRLAALLGIREPAGLVGRLYGGMRPDEAMLEAIRGFRARGVRTGLISNSWGAGSYEGVRLGDLFDGVVISGEEGIRKPDPAIYALGAERIGLAPAECVFVDDLGGNLKPALRLGMATVRHTSAQETIPQLEELLGVSLA